MGLRLHKYIFALLLLSFFWQTTFSQINVRYHLYQGQKNLSNKEYQQSISWMNKIIYYQPENTDALLIRGISKYYLSDYYGAKSDFTKVLEFEPYHYDAYYFRGIINATQGNTKQSLEDLNQAIALFEYNPDYFSYRGQLNLSIGDTLAAISDYENAIKLDEEHYQAHLNMGLLKMYAEEYEQAIVLCTKAIQLQPDSYRGYITRGKTYYMVDSTELAIHDLEFVLSEDSTNIEALFILALTYHKAKDYNKALNNYDKALDLNPYNAICYYNRAILKSELELYQGAVFDYTKVIELNSNNIYAYLYRGRTKYLLKQYKQAEEDLSVAIELYPKFTDAYMTRAAVRFELNDTLGFLQDKYMARELSSGDSLLFTEQIDSTYIQKITEFKTDFSPIEQGSKVKVQYINRDINMLPLYTARLYEKVALNMFSDIDFELFSQVNTLEENYKIGIFYEEGPGFIKDIEQWEKKLDALLEENSKIQDLSLLKGLAVGWKEKFYLSDKYLGDAMEQLPNEKYLVYFIRGNHYFAQAEAVSNILMNDQIAYIDNRDIQEHPDYKSVESYYFKAVAFYKKALLYKPDFIYARYNKAFVEAILNNMQEAVNDYSKCLEIDQEFGTAYFNRGLIYLLTGETKKGCGDLSKAGELGIEQSYNIIYKYCD